MRLFLVAAASVLVAVACSTGSDVPAVDGAAARWMVDSVPALEIPGTGADGEPAFHYAAAATQLSNGNVVVADPYSISVRFFDAAGKPVKSVGRGGEGPGEFGALWWLQQCGHDSIFVWDYMDGRTTVLNAEGRVARVFRQAAQAMDLACSRTGAVAGIAPPLVNERPNAETPHYRSALWVTDAAGTVHQAGEVPVGENRPLGMMSKLALGADRLYLGTGESDTIRVYTLDGKPAGTLTLGITRRRPTARNYERAIDAQIAMLPAGRSRDEGRKMLLDIPMPRYLPAISALFTDPEGWVWAVVSGPGDAATELRGVSGDGQRRAELTVPEEIRVFEVGGDYVLGVHEDAEGEQRILKYAYRRGPL